MTSKKELRVSGKWSQGLGSLGPQRGKAPWLGAPLGPWGPSMGGKALGWRSEQWARQTCRVTGKKGFRVTGKWTVQHNRRAKQIITCRNFTTIELWKTIDLSTVLRIQHVLQRSSLFFGRIDDDDFDDSSTDLTSLPCFC